MLEIIVCTVILAAFVAVFIWLETGIERDLSRFDGEPEYEPPCSPTEDTAPAWMPPLEQSDLTVPGKRQAQVEKVAA